MLNTTESTAMSQKYFAMLSVSVKPLVLSASRHTSALHVL